MPINARTRFYLLLGNPVEHSLSPPMHNSAFDALGLNCVYLACPVDYEHIGAAVRGMKALSAAGGNVTAPFKEAVIHYLDSVSPESEHVKSVNTIINRGGMLYGTTTDGEGFYRYLSQTDPSYSSGQTVLVVGAGGAARAVAYTLAHRGAGEIIVANRSGSRGRALCQLLSEKTPLQNCSYISLDGRSMGEVLARCRLVVYSLPFDAPEFDDALTVADGLDVKQLLIDLRYNPDQTGIMEAFERKGGGAYNGLGMLVWQAVKSFELFTGEKAPGEIMQKAAGVQKTKPST